MTDNPITPPPELRQLWAQQAQRLDLHDPVAWMEHVSTQAARWGADQELEACCAWVEREIGHGREWGAELRAARRPKPPSLKEQALHALLHIDQGQHNERYHIIRRALEALDD